MCKCKYCGKEFKNKSSLPGHYSHCKERDAGTKRTPESRSKASKKASYTLRLKRLKENPYRYQNKIFILKCNKCGKEYSVETTQYKIDKGEYSHYCSLECRNSHVVSEQTKNKIRNGISNFMNTKEYSDNFKKLYKTYYCKVCGTPFNMLSERNCNGRQYCSSECKHKFLSDKTGGYRKGSGRGKSGWYKGIYCDSSWELAYVIYHVDNDIPISRCTEHRKYIYKGVIREYIPDFVVPSGIVEIKGYVTEQWKAKHDQNKDVTVLYKKEIKPYIDYVIKKYGVDFIKLYDDSNPKKDTSGLKYVWVHNNKKNTTIDPGTLQEYVNAGYVRGRCKFK